MNCNIQYETGKGRLYIGNSDELLNDDYFNKYKGKIKLIFTSPPFPLNRKKKYGNLSGDEYIEWLCGFAKTFGELIADNGSIVIEIGNAWEHKLPVASTLPIEALLEFKKAGNFFLCQEFIYYNPAKLPTPVQWVNKERIRVKDSFSKIWWLSKTPWPDADNRRVLKAYSKKMSKLIDEGKYNSGKRPSEHKIGERSFLNDNGGAIPPNVVIASNTVSNDQYIKYCKNNNLNLHPARMPEDLAKFFIQFLTSKDEIVLDPFAGSNTTGAVSEKLGRKWLSIEADDGYAKGSYGRFI